MARQEQKDKITVEHANANLLCAIDIRRTGAILDYHDIVQICLVPIDYHLQRMKGHKPFYCDIRPRHMDRIDEETMDLPREKMLEISKHGLDWISAAEYLEKWFDGLGLLHKKRIMPVCHQWHKIQPYLYTWLGQKTFDYIFDDRVRDVQSASLFINDYHFYHIENVPFQKNDFGYLCSDSKVIREKGIYRDTMTDCMALIELYRKMCGNGSRIRLVLAPGDDNLVTI